MKLVLSERLLAAKVASLHAQYQQLARVAQTYRVANWSGQDLSFAQLRTKDDMLTWQAVREANATLKHLIQAEEDLRLRRHPRYAWRFEHCLVLSLPATARWVARKLGLGHEPRAQAL